MPTPNYFYRAYSLGRTHTGMLAYLCDLYNVDEQKPLRDVLEHLGFAEIGKLPEKIGVQFEFKQADLGLFDGDHCFLLIEMKVDDREGWKKANSKDVFDNKKGWYKDLGDIEEGKYYRQTKLYQHRAHQHNLWAKFAEKEGKKLRKKYAGSFKPGTAPEVLLVSLGVGEALAAVRHIGLETWYEAFAKTPQNNLLFEKYVSALKLELEIRGFACDLTTGWNGNEDHTQQRLNHHGAMYRLTSLLKHLKKPKNWSDDFGWHPTVLTAGSQGDVILQFNYPPEKQAWREKYPLYIELMGSGNLRFKLASTLIPTKPQKQASHNLLIELMGLAKSNFGRGGLTRPSRKSNPQTTKHLTLAEVPVGLIVGVRFAEGTKSVEEVVQKIQAGLELYAELMDRLI